MLRYLPSVEVRERFIGDRNGIVSTRTTGTLESARSLVYADGILLSNLLYPAEAPISINDIRVGGFHCDRRELFDYH